MNDFCSLALQTLTESLLHVSTPSPIIDIIKLGITNMIQNENGAKRCKPPTNGSLKPADILATNCIACQEALGWFKILKGHLTKSWRAFYNHFKPSQDTSGLLWASKVIKALWHYAESIWKYRNGVVHGHNLADQHRIEKEVLTAQVAAEYAAYDKDPFLVPRWFSYLFEKHTLAERQRMSKDNLRCWLRSVVEAKHLSAIDQDRQMKQAAFFFPRRTTPTHLKQAMILCAPWRTAVS
jgi:hypothetical protein